MKNTFFSLLALAACGLSASCSAQTPASTPTGGFQPLSPYAVDVCLGGRYVRANVVGQVVSKYGTWYEIETRRGRTRVGGSALLGLPGDPRGPRRPDRRHSLPPNVHTFR